MLLSFEAAASLVAFNRGPHAHRFWLKCETFRNMSCMSLAFLTSQLEMSWFTFDRRNIWYMDPTLETSQLGRPTPVKATAVLNIRYMVVTREVSKCDKFWLKENAPENIRSMLVALEVFQLVSGSLKLERLAKASLKLTNRSTHQFPITGPYTFRADVALKAESGVLT
jgi:hypothetical protein